MGAKAVLWLTEKLKECYRHGEKQCSLLFLYILVVHAMATLYISLLQITANFNTFNIVAVFILLLWLIFLYIWMDKYFQRKL